MDITLTLDYNEVEDAIVDYVARKFTDKQVELMDHVKEIPEQLHIKVTISPIPKGDYWSDR
jgi:hypothetical protein